MTNGSVKTVVFSVLAMILSVEECRSDPKISTVHKSCNSLTVNWTRREGVDKYQLQYKPTAQTGGWLNKFTNETMFEITDLLPNTTYIVRIKSVTEGNKAILATGMFTLLPDTGSISINEVRLTGNSLQFKLSGMKSGSTQQYRCWTTPHNNEGRNDITFDPEGTGIFSGLQPNINYTIDCEGDNNCYVSRTRISIRISAPDKVNAVVVDGVGRVVGDQIHQSISWKRPPHHTSQLHYIVKYGPSSVVDRPTHPSVNTTTSSNTTVILTLPIPTTPVVYNVWVAVVSDVGQGEYRMINFTYTKPSPPENITIINKTCNSLSVQWSPPSDTGGLAITGYRVDVAENSFTTNTTMTRTDITNLSPNTTYRVKVKTITSFKLRSGIATNITTLKRNKLQLHLRPFSSTGLNLTITPPHNKDGVSYTCTLTPGNKTLSGNFTLTDLSPNTTYSVRCWVFKNGEDLCYEGITNGSTFPSVPEEEPSNVTVTKTESNQFTVRWGPPRGYEYNQDILGYNVKYWRATGSGDNATTNKNVTTTTYTATGLDTNTVYTFRVAAYTEEGIGVYSEPVNISTIPTVESISVSELTNTTAEVKWAAPSGDYQVWLELSVDDDFQYGNRTFGKVNVTNTTQHQLSGLDPYRSYTIEMYLVGELGNGSKENKPFRTLGSEPTDAPYNTSVKTNKSEATLQWRIPIVSGRNGIITSYEIHWRSANTQTSPITHNVSQPNFTHPEQISRTIQGLTPYTTYIWRVAAVNVNGTGPFSAWDNFTTEEDVPELVRELTAINRTNSTITVEWEPPSTPNGVITSYKVCYWILDSDKCSQQSNTTETEETIRELEPGVPYRVSVTAYTSAGPGPENILNETIFTEELLPNGTVTNITIKWMNATTVNISWVPLGIHQSRGFPSYTVIISSEGTPLKNKTTNDSSVVIGELNNNRVYTVNVQPLTEGGSGEWSEPEIFGTQPTLTSVPNIYTTAGAATAALLLALGFVIILMAAIVHRMKRTRSYRTKTEDIPLEFHGVQEVNVQADEQGIQRKPSIPRGQFCEHVKRLHQKKNKDFILEFSSITQHPNFTYTAAENNTPRNRYINIYSYDHSRVILINPDGSDYINASYIDGYTRPKAYIACQGPITNTIADFWQMVWEHKSTVIVMLTHLKEGDRPKCVQYWSEELNTAFEPGRNLSVTLTKEDTMSSYEIRYFQVRKASETSDPLLVKHFLYTAWPDHGVPQYSSSMVKFILQQIKLEMDKTTAPIVVHCSAGAGRTGTFIAIDTALDRLEEEDNINIFECVEMMRTKRTQMVQNVDQYMYVHDAINDHVTCGDSIIVAHELGQKITEMSIPNSQTGLTGYGKHFQMLELLSPEFGDADKSFAQHSAAAGRIRYKDRFTYIDQYIKTKDDEHYVNASAIPGYYGQSGFIAAQAPLKNTIEDTWNVIREQNCSVVVVLCNLVEEEQVEEMGSCFQFYSTDPGKTMNTDNTKVTTVRLEEVDNYSIIEVTSTQEDQNAMPTIVYQYKAWEKHGRPDVSSLLKLMGDVQKSQQGHTGPVMVMCDDGMSRTGVFITVMSEIDRVKVEGEMDIFHTIKAARTARPYMVSTVADYECCHEILQQYLESFDTYANFQ